jgi:hypothetical protein
MGREPAESQKMLFRGNELSYLLQTNDLTFFGAKNELVFECKKGQTNSKKYLKNHLLRGIEPVWG